MFRDPFLETVRDKVLSGTRVTLEEGVRCLESPDLLGLGRIADQVKRRRTGDRVTYVVNRQINPTNVCVLSCRFCDFASKKGRPDAVRMTIAEVLSKCSSDLREVHIVGGLDPDWSFEDYAGILSAIRDGFPSIQIKAYTAVEIDFFARRARLGVREVLLRLKDAGLVCLPGGGAEVFSERVRKLLFPFKIGAPRWLEIHRTAHGLGIRSNATLLYGHVETLKERAAHMVRLRELQDETGGFLSFIPLAYQPGKTRLSPRDTSAVDDLKTIAVSRILLDNFDHIKSYWVTMGEETASMALHFGADDLDGTIGEEKIMHAALSKSPAGLARGKLERLIRDAGMVPAERDALYNLVREREPEEAALAR
ncbi:MAG: aminofutalosine synthase MqnE [Elusimicrobia bacterium RIFCSPHIGHO2_01_FULL_64_10]|nr:MAG: aminofutalosine synthase MqnE [Elusimicrobia bacterium RIFCSPHIGHO2_01_FULL_64_10]